MAQAEHTANNTGIIVLAAGGSSRLGKPKQLLPYKRQSLLQHAVQAAGALTAHPVVVLGAHADKLKEELTTDAAHIVINTEWQEGMASSIRCGINALAQINPSAEGAVLMVCDQPYVTTSLLNELIIAHQKTRKPIVACGYGDTFGPPVFFHHSLFNELLQLEGDIGARGVIRQHTDDVEVILFPEGTVDMDTEKDYEELLRNSGQK